MSDAPAAPVPENGVPPVPQEVEDTPGFKVFAGNLAYSTTDEGLKAFFAPVQSDVLAAQVIMRNGARSAGYGFVTFTTEEAAKKAVELLDKKELEGRAVIVEVAKPADQKDKEKKQRRFTKKRTGRRGSKSVPGEVSEAEANGDASADASKAEGAPASDEAAKSKKKKKARKPKRKASEGEAPASGEAATTAEGADAAGAKKTKPRKPRTPRPPRPVGEDPQGELSKSVLFVANLGFNIEDAGLAALFTDAGIKVTSARIVRRRWGKPRRSKGYGFVDVGDETEQQKAIEALQGKDVGGRALAVKVAVNAVNDGEDSEGNDVKAEDTAAEVAPAAA